MKKDSDNMKVLVTGVKGQLGFDVVRVLKEKNIDYLGIDKDDADITNKEEITKVVIEYKPTVIVHCAAYTAVDKAEEDKELCYNINVIGTKNLVGLAKELDSKFIYISTDYVFDGNGLEPFKPTDKPNPINYYGLTKYQGELEVQKELEKYFIVRISWVFGINGNNFVKTMLKLAETRNEINVVSDQIGSPTYTYDLSYRLVDLLKMDDYGIYHITNNGFISWYEFATKIFELANLDVKVNPILTKDYPTKAKRPFNSRMEATSLTLRDWDKALNHYIKELKKNV